MRLFLDIVASWLNSGLQFQTSRFEDQSHRQNLMTISPITVTIGW